MIDVLKPKTHAVIFDNWPLRPKYMQKHCFTFPVWHGEVYFNHPFLNPIVNQDRRRWGLSCTAADDLRSSEGNVLLPVGNNSTTALSTAAWFICWRHILIFTIHEPPDNVLWHTAYPCFWPVPQYKGTFCFERTPSCLSVTCQYFRLNTAYGSLCPKGDLFFFMPYPDSWNMALWQVARWAVLVSACVQPGC